MSTTTVICSNLFLTAYVLKSVKGAPKTILTGDNGEDYVYDDQSNKQDNLMQQQSPWKQPEAEIE